MKYFIPDTRYQLMRFYNTVQMRNVWAFTLFLLLTLMTFTRCQADVLKDAIVVDTTITGIIQTEEGNPVAGAIVKIKGTNRYCISNQHGQFSVSSTTTDTLVITALGFSKVLLPLGRQHDSLHLSVLLKQELYQLNGVVVSTGYEKVPAERATGSFDYISKTSFNRSSSTDLLSRLDGIANGLVFNRNTTENSISIRGRSTLYSNAEPLIIVDNFPYTGDINSINPNDVKNITVLKDAAAASIWGARAGNGVIVITTKQGGYNQPLQVTAKVHITAGEKFNPFYRPQMTPAAFVDNEKKLFADGYYNYYENSPYHYPLSPVVETLIKERDGLISIEQADAMITTLSHHDVRDDFKRYFYRNSLDQQYSIDFNGGTKIDHYYFSTGYDKNLNTEIKDNYDRYTLNLKNTFRFLNDKVEFHTGLYYSESKTIENQDDFYNIYLAGGLYPYAQLADAQGNPLYIYKDYREGFVTDAQNKGFLDWRYSPLNELSYPDDIINQYTIRINTGLKWRIIPGLDASVNYQYIRGNTRDDDLHSINSYFTRDLINKFTEVNDDGTLTRPVPIGDVLDRHQSNSKEQNLRIQFNLNKTWHEIHHIVAIAGWEMKDASSSGFASRLYGYNKENASSIPVDLVNSYTLYTKGYSSYIPDVSGISFTTDRFLSLFSNASYTYKNTYTISASARFDRSNLFGVKTNQKGIPLWSSGFSWRISHEPFYRITWLPQLKLRATYGFNGNIDRSITAFTTAQIIGTSPLSGLNYAQIFSPPNPNLRWERDKIINLGIDFGLLKDRIDGSIDMYIKNGSDLIGDIPVVPSSGMTSFRGNVSNTKGRGVDVKLMSRNINGVFKWNTTLNFSYAKSIVTNYTYDAYPMDYLTNGDQSVFPMSEHPLFSLYALRWGGLNPETGAPCGYLNGKVSEDYSSIIRGLKVGDLQYIGPARPVIFGNVYNAFTWKKISLSANITYRLGYYYRKNSVNYASLLTGNLVHSDYARRWEKPGDETITQVPSLPEMIDRYRDDIYLYSTQLVHKADNIRLQDIRLGYSINGMKYVHHLEVFGYIRNVGILWRAYKDIIDSDYEVAPARISFTLGLNANF